jgi:hypothetical protein
VLARLDLSLARSECALPLAEEVRLCRLGGVESATTRIAGACQLNDVVLARVDRCRCSIDVPGGVRNLLLARGKLAFARGKLLLAHGELLLVRSLLSAARRQVV